MYVYMNSAYIQIMYAHTYVGILNIGGWAAPNKTALHTSLHTSSELLRLCVSHGYMRKVNSKLRVYVCFDQ